MAAHVTARGGGGTNARERGVWAAIVDNQAAGRHSTRNRGLPVPGPSTCPLIAPLRLIKKELPNPGDHNALLELWGTVDRDSKGNYTKVPEKYTAIEDDADVEAKANFDNLVKNSVQFTIDVNAVSIEAMAELLRNLPRNN